MSNIYFKGHQINETNTTTETARGCRNVFEIDCGPHSKAACVRPFLTSVAACRSYINQGIELAAEANVTSNEAAAEFLLSHGILV